MTDQAAPSPKPNPVSVRLPPDVKSALEAAARRDSRSLSSMMEKVLTDWLREQKLLPPA